MNLPLRLLELPFHNLLKPLGFRFMTSSEIESAIETIALCMEQVDRCVTGLVAQQQTVGPLQLPVANVAVLAQVCTHTIAITCTYIR